MRTAPRNEASAGPSGSCQRIIVLTLIFIQRLNSRLDLLYLYRRIRESRKSGLASGGSERLQNTPLSVLFLTPRAVGCHCCVSRGHYKGCPCNQCYVRLWSREELTSVQQIVHFLSLLGHTKPRFTITQKQPAARTKQPTNLSMKMGFYLALWRWSGKFGIH